MRTFLIKWSMFLTPLWGFQILSCSLAWTVLTRRQLKVNIERLLLFSSLYTSRSRKVAMRDQLHQWNTCLHDVADVSSLPFFYMCSPMMSSLWSCNNEFEAKKKLENKKTCVNKKKSNCIVMNRKSKGTMLR